ncbi:hypothetical protein EON65_48360 [archaeon]|nr:MAG: hypothetical protein EON65_48360 [archaeon]
MLIRRKLLCILFIVLGIVIFSCSSILHGGTAIQSFAKSSLFSENEPADEIDESLYSRQLLVYGKTAQSRLQNAKVIVMGSNRVGEEVVKNLALTGVGHLFLCELNSTRRNMSLPSLVSNETSLVAYASSLNPYIKVDALKFPVDSIKTLNPDLVVVAGASFAELMKINKICRANKIKMVSSGFIGLVGYVFNDFLDDFMVEDVDGETYKEVGSLYAVIPFKYFTQC